MGCREELYPLPTSPCMQEEEQKAALPPLLAGEGWGGVAPDLIASLSNSLPTSPCLQGEEQARHRDSQV